MLNLALELTGHLARSMLPRSVRKEKSRDQNEERCPRPGWNIDYINSLQQGLCECGRQDQKHLP